MGDVVWTCNFFLPKVSSGIELVLEEFPEPVKASVSLAAALRCSAETSDNYTWHWIALAMI